MDEVTVIFEVPFWSWRSGRSSGSTEEDSLRVDKVSTKFTDSGLVDNRRTDLSHDPRKMFVSTKCLAALLSDALESFGSTTRNRWNVSETETDFISRAES